MPRTSWFTVDRHGLSALVTREGIGWVLLELIANAWDAEECTGVLVSLDYDGKHRLCSLYVEDNSPVGFPELSHAYTLFAHTDKRHDPAVRGRFNLGEKLAIAGAISARVHTTTGLVTFDKQRGRRISSANRRGLGTRVALDIRCTRQQYEEAHALALACVPDKAQPTYVNQVQLCSRQARAAWLPMTAKALPSVLAGDDGRLRPTRRDTVVWVLPDTAIVGETWLYEMGIPIRRLDDGEPFGIDIMGKIPVDMLKGLVAPRFMRSLHVSLLNNYHDHLEAKTAFDGKARWVRSAMENKLCSDAAAKTVVRARFGSQAVSYDPSDKEGSNIAVAKGYTVVHGGAMSKQEWVTVKRADALKPAGQVTPGPKLRGVDKTARTVPVSEWTLNQTIVVEHVREVLKHLVGPVHIRLVTGDNLGWEATWTKQMPAVDNCIARLDFSVTDLGMTWFANAASANMWEHVHDLMLHEAAHQAVANHLDAGYHAELSRLGAKLTHLALQRPELFPASKESSHASSSRSHEP
jgi:hypothetical protein